MPAYGGGLTWNGHKGTFWNNQNILSLNWSGGFSAVHICQNLANATLNVFILFMKITLQLNKKLLQKIIYIE